MAKPDHRAIVAKDHSLIDKMSKYKLQELRLIAYCLAHYNSSKAENREFQASVEDMRSIYPTMNEKNAYTVIRETVKGLGSKPLEFIEDGELVYWNWFSGFKYKIGEATFKFYINPELQPYLLELKGAFTRYRLQDVYQFKSATTWKLYEHLKKCWEHSKSWSVSLDELKIKLGIPKKYPKWNDFRKWTIDPAIKDINKHSDITVSYEKKKHIRTVTGVIFFVDEKQPDDVIKVESQHEKILKLLLENGVHPTTADNYTKKIEDSGRTSDLINKIPAMRKRWTAGKPKDQKTGKEIPLPKYLQAAIKDELRRQELPFEKPEKALRAEAEKCWASCKGTCGVFRYGTPPQPACQFCPGKSKIL